MGFFLLSLSILSFGISNCLWVIPFRQFTFLQVIVLRSFLTSCFFAIILAVLSFTKILVVPIASFDIVDIAIAILISVFSFFGLYFFVQSLKFEKVSLAVPVSSISGVFGVLTGIVIFQELVSVKFFAACLFVLVGVNIVNVKSLSTFRLSRGVWYNLVAAFFWGVSFALFQFPVKALGAIVFSFILELTVFICSLILLRLEKSTWTFPINKITDRYILALAILGFGGIVFYNLALTYIPVTQASFLGVLTPVVSIIAASFLYKEKLTVKQYLGITLIIISLMLVKLN